MQWSKSQKFPQRWPVVKEEQIRFNATQKRREAPSFLQTLRIRRPPPRMLSAPHRKRIKSPRKVMAKNPKSLSRPKRTRLKRATRMKQIPHRKRKNLLQSSRSALSSFRLPPPTRRLSIGIKNSQIISIRQTAPLRRIIGSRSVRPQAAHLRAFVWRCMRHHIRRQRSPTWSSGPSVGLGPSIRWVRVVPRR